MLAYRFNIPVKKKGYLCSVQPYRFVLQTNFKFSVIIGGNTLSNNLFVTIAPQRYYE